MKAHIIIFASLILFFSCSNPNQHKAEAERYFKENKYDSALIEINKAIELEPDSLNHYEFRIMIYDIMGRFKEEIFDLDKIITHTNARSRLSLNAYHQRAFVKMQLGLYKDALSDINYFIDKRDTVGSLAEAYLNKATILYGMKDSENSANFYNLSILENSGHNKSIEVQALVGLANLSASPVDELNFLNKAISIDKENASPYGARGALYLNLGEIDNAYTDLKKAISKEPNEATNIASVFFNMGQLFANYKDNIDSAIIYFKKAIQFSPQSPDNDRIYMNLAVIENRSGKLDDALGHYKEAEKINPKNDLLLFNFAYLLSDMNKNKEALGKINRAIKINSNDADYFNLKGSILLDLESYQEAEVEFKNAIKINPKFAVAYYNLGYLFSVILDHEQSIKYYDKAVLLNHDLKATLVNRALEKIEINNVSGACADLKKAYSLGRSDVKPLMEEYCK